MTTPTTEYTKLSAEEESALKEELKTTEDDIANLRSALSSKLRHADEIKKKLNMGILNEFTNDFNTGLKQLRESETYNKTVDMMSTAKNKVTETFEAAKNSEAVKSIGVKLESTYSTVKDKLVGKEGNATGGDTFESTLEAEKAGIPRQ